MTNSDTYSGDEVKKVRCGGAKGVWWLWGKENN